MAKAKNGDKVKVHYTGRLDDGTVFDSSLKRDPLEFKIGENKIIPSFEEAVVGMEVGDTKTFGIPATEAYGDRQDDMVLTLDRKQLPDNMDPQVGQQLQLSQEDGNHFLVVVTDVSDDNVTIDANHPLAGEALTFDVELLEIY